MEPLFELRYTKDPNESEYDKEISRRIAFDPPLIVFIVFVVIYFIGCYVMLRRIYFPTIFALYAVILLICIRVVAYFRMVKFAQKRYIELYGDVVSHVVVTVTDDAVRYSSSVASDDVVLKLSSIRKIYRTKHLIAFRSEANIIYSLRLDAFIKGTPEEFILFLNSKGFKVK